MGGGSSSNAFDAIDPKKVFEPLIHQMEDGFKDTIVKPVNDGFDAGIAPIKDGIDDMVREVNKIPERFDELGDIVTDEFNEFDGIMKDEFTQFGDIIKKMVIDNIWNPINDKLIIPAKNFFDMVTMYINCAIDKITNFWRCFIWYAIYIVQETLHIMMIGLCFIINEITGNNILLDAYNMILKGWGYLSDIFNEYTGFELLIFPYSDKINAECFVCDAKNDTKKPIIQTKMREMKQEIQDETKQFTDFTKNVAKNISNL